MSTQTDRLGGAKGSLAYKAPVRVATTANITLSGTQTIDGINVVSEDRVLVKNQTNGYENGIYLAKTTGWVRAKDMDGSGDVVRGTRIDVQYGTVGAGTYVLTTADPITLGTTSLTFTKQAFVTGPVSSTANNVPVFTDATGTGISDSGVGITTLVTTSDIGSSTATNGVQAYTAATTDVLTAADLGISTAGNPVQKYVGSTATIQTTANIGVDIQAYDADILAADIASTLSAGFSETPYSIGTSTATIAVNSSLGNVQYVTNNGQANPVALSTPSLKGRYVVEVINSATPGNLTYAGYGNYVTGTPSTEASAVNVAVIYALNSIAFLDWKSTV